jgi:hypothetical protein
MVTIYGPGTPVPLALQGLRFFEENTENALIIPRKLDESSESAFQELSNERSCQ